MDKIGIVLVNYNGEKFQNDCIRTIKSQTYKNFEIIVVDNNSQDNSVQLLEDVYPDVTLIEVGENVGVARGNNIGIKHALKSGCDYILLLNNDTEVDKDMLKHMVESASENTITVPKMYYFEPKNVIWCAGGEINWRRATTTHYGMGEIDNGQYNEGKFIEYAPTCSMLIHKNVFKKVGLMDEKYFMYYDDTDFCVRINKLDFQILYVPNALLWHKVSSSSGGESSLTSIYYGDRNRLYFINKFYKAKLKVKSFYFMSRFIRIIQWFIKLDFERSKMTLKGIFDFKNKRMGLMKN